MANKIQIRRGLEADLPTLSAGEFGFCTDTGNVYIGNGSENKLVTIDGEQLLDAAQAAAGTVTNSPAPTTKAYVTGTTSSEENTGTQVFDTGVYLDTEAGEITATTFNGALSGNAATATSASKLGTSTVGSGSKPIYLSSGTATASTSTIGNGTKPIYMSSGTLTASASTIGNGTKPIYMSSGTITASTSTVGDTNTPVYMSSGTITAGTKNKNYATYVIAASDSANTDRADYICDGTADEEQIQEALDALPSAGGKILFMEGTYNIESTITYKETTKRITLEGAGATLAFADKVQFLVYAKELTLRDLAITASLSAADKCFMIICDGCRTRFYNCDIDIDTLGAHFIAGYYSIANTVGDVIMQGCTFNYTCLEDAVDSCASALFLIEKVRVADCDITLTNNAVISASVTPRLNFIYDASHDTSYEETRAEITNCHMECYGNEGGASNSLVCVSDSPYTNISNCDIIFNDYGNFSPSANTVDGSYGISITGCRIVNTGSNYIGFKIFSNNYMSHTKGGIVYFTGGAIVSGNYFNNNTIPACEVYNNGAVTFVGNRLCESQSSSALTTATSYTVIENNVGIS